MGDIIFGLIFAGLSIWVYLQARTFPRVPGYPGPGFFPTLLAFVLLGASVCLIGSGTKQILKKFYLYRWKLNNFAGLDNFVCVIAMVLLYLLLSTRIGFFFSSSLVLFLLMLKLGTRIWAAFAAATITAAVLKLLFQGIFKIPLPYGPLPGGW